jgi:O-antigen/teichoic acid export membrane protein
MREVKPRSNWQGHSGLAKNAAWVTAGQVIRVGVQAVYFVLIARALGSRNFGAFVSVVALVAIVAPFAGLGSGNLLIKHVSREPDTFAQHWGKAIAVTVMTSVILLGVISCIGTLWLPASIPLQLILLVGASDLLFVRLVDVSAQAYQAHQRLSRTAIVQLLLSPLRLVAGGSLVAATSTPTILQWGVMHLLSAIIAATIAVVLVNRELGMPRFVASHVGAELREGALFAANVSAQSSTNDIDKTMLARLSTLEATGLYGAAYRLIDVSFLPVGSLLIASYARFFQHGVKGIHATAQFARRLLGLVLGYGTLVAAGLYLVAPALPALLGNEYGQATSAIRWLAILPFLKGIYYFGADALTGAGYQGTRTLIQAGIAVLNILLNFWLIPAYSWQGAAAATLVSEGLLGLVIWITIWRIRQNEGGIQTPPKVMSIAELG